MTGNPFMDPGAFYKKTWRELRQQLPLASGMQLYEASERITQELDTLFYKRAREMAFEYEEHDRIARERQSQIDPRLITPTEEDKL
jgi:hypothetical protein